MLPQINGLVQDCSNSSANAMELLQSCAKPPKYLTNSTCIRDAGKCTHVYSTATSLQVVIFQPDHTVSGFILEDSE